MEGTPKQPIEGKKVELLNGTKIEIGPIFEDVQWFGIQEKLSEANKTLGPDEIPWRIPTAEELNDFGEELRQICEDVDYPSHTESLNDLNPEDKEKINSVCNKYGIKWLAEYWSNDIDKLSDPEMGEDAFYLSTYDGTVQSVYGDTYSKKDLLLIR